MNFILDKEDDVAGDDRPGHCFLSFDFICGGVVQ